MPYKNNHTCKVVIIAGQLVVGGAERQLYLWLSHMDREIFQPVVLTLHPGYGDYWEKYVEALNIPLLRIPRRKSRLVRLLDIVRVSRAYKPELIHAWHLFASPYAGAAAKLLGTKSLGAVRGNFQAFRDAPIESNLSLWMVDGIVANSSFVARQLQDVRKRKHQRIYAVQNSVVDQVNNRLKTRERLSQSYGLSSEIMWLGSLGRLEHGKRFDLLFNVLALLSAEQIAYQFILIGDGPERARLEEIASTLGIRKHVFFTGEIPNASKLLRALDIFCFASLDEGLPNAVMEAAVAGLPIISWRTPFMQEILKNGEVALLVEPKNLADFQNKLIQLMHSPNLREELGRKAREHVLDRFCVNRFVQKMTDIYNEFLGIDSSVVYEIS